MTVPTANERLARQFRIAGYPANPWAGRRRCPQCDTTTWTLPFDPTHPATGWLCIDQTHGTIWISPPAERMAPRTTT